ncbi:MAG: hypothetical protein NVSMB52_17160 [Chloroflexota bacterium]
MSRIDLACAAGVSKAHVHQIETGQRTRMRLATLSKYARALGVPESYIDYGTGTDAQEQGTDVVAALRRATNLDDNQIEQVVRLIQMLEMENLRSHESRRGAAALRSHSMAEQISKRRSSAS